MGRSGRDSSRNIFVWFIVSPEFTISPILSKKNCFHGSWRFLIGLRLDLRSPLTAVLRAKIFYFTFDQPK